MCVRACAHMREERVFADEPMTTRGCLVGCMTLCCFVESLHYLCWYFDGVCHMPSCVGLFMCLHINLCICLCMPQCVCAAVLWAGIGMWVCVYVTLCQCACVWCRLMIAWFGVCVASCGFKPSDDGESWGYTGTCRLSHKNTCSQQSNKVKLKWTFPLIAVLWTQRSDFPLTALSSQSVTTEGKDVWFYFSNNTMKRLRQTMCFHSQPSETKNKVLNILLVSLKIALREVKWSVLT